MDKIEKLNGCCGEEAKKKELSLAFSLRSLNLLFGFSYAETTRQLPYLYQSVNQNSSHHC